LLATVEPIMSGQMARDYLAQAVTPTLLKGLTELCKQKPQQPVVSTTRDKTLLTYCNCSSCQWRIWYCSIQMS